MAVSLVSRSRSLVHHLFGAPARVSGRRGRRTFHPTLDRLEPRLALAVDTLSIGGEQVAGFTDASGDMVVVSITGSAGTAVFRDAGDGPVGDGDDIASVTITGASPDFQLTVGASTGILPGSIRPLNGVFSVYLGRITADSVIRGVNTVTSPGPEPSSVSSTAIYGDIVFVLESFEGVNFSKGGGLFVDVVTGDDENFGVVLTDGFSPYTTIAIREQLDAFILLGANNNGTADGRLLIESASSESLIFVNYAGNTGTNSKLEILGGEGPFDAGVGFRGSFAGTVNLQSPAGGTWLFEGNVAQSAVLKAAAWNGLTVSASLPPGVNVRGTFAGTLNATAGAVSLTVGGAVKGTARINSADRVTLDAASVAAGAEINAAARATVDVTRNFAGRVSADDVTATVGGTVAGATMSSASSVSLDVTGSITNSTLTAFYGVSGTVGGTISNSTLRSGTDEISLSIAGNIVNSRFISTEQDVRLTVGGSVSRSAFTAGGKMSLAIGRSMTSSLVDAGKNLSMFVSGDVSKSKFFYGQSAGFLLEPDLRFFAANLLDSDFVSRNATIYSSLVHVARDARGVQFMSEQTEGIKEFLIGRNFQGSIEDGADVLLYVGGSVQKGSSLVASGNAEVIVNRNFDGVVNVKDLVFRVTGNVSKDSRIVANQVRDWRSDINALVLLPNFTVGGRFDGIVNVGVFDAFPGDTTVTVVGGGAGKSARFYVGRFNTDTIVFQGNFQGNVRVLQDLVANLQFSGNLDRITIGGQVLADITVGGTLSYLNSNSYFRPTGAGKKTGEFLNGRFQQTGSLTTGKYVTVVPVGPAVG